MNINFLDARRESFEKETAVFQTVSRAAKNNYWNLKRNCFANNKGVGKFKLVFNFGIFSGIET